MEEWCRLEFEYAAKLRVADSETRRGLYAEAYTAVGKHRVFKSSAPEDRTAGTSRVLVDQLRSFLKPSDRVLEIGAGRGYTGLMLAPHVKSYLMTEVSGPSIAESREVLRTHGIQNASVLDVSAIDLEERLVGQRFDSAISIEVVEHLHPDDASEHLRQVFSLLEPGGRYIICMPNRLDGPHDITRDEYPLEKKALGFHLNESTYREIVNVMRSIGYTGFSSFRPFRGRTIVLPATVNIVFEHVYESARIALARKFLSIQLCASKPV